MRVFKYRGGEFERDLNSLSENFFWAPTRDALNDPCEGFFDRNKIELQFKTISDIFVGSNKNSERNFQEVKKSLNDVLNFVDKSGIYSLSKTPLEELLWAHYGCSHKGFCIEYDLDELIAYEKQDYKTLNVNYKNVPQSIDVDDINNSEALLLKILGTKSEVWEYESEIRVITSASGEHEYNFKAVKAIYFGLRISDIDKNRLMDTLKGRGIEYFQIELQPNSYEFSFKKVNDLFADAQVYKYSIAPISEDAINPDQVNENYKIHTDFLYKAAEIVRREPNCKEVKLVDFSPTKGDFNNPVIYVQYDRKINRSINHYLSLNEIEEQFELITDLN